MKPLHLSILAGAIAAVAATGYADGHAGLPPELKARHGEMQMIAFHLGVIGNMARGNIDYDADVAQTAADNLAALGTVSQDLLWSEGTAAGEVEGSRALPTIWSDRDGFFSAWDDYGEATVALQAVAGDGLDALRGGLGGVGRTCGGCHDTYRQPSQ